MFAPDPDAPWTPAPAGGQPERMCTAAQRMS
jgi:hypothetical protein